MRKPALRDIDPSKTYRLLESGPVALVVTHDGRRANVMTPGFHMVMRHSPPLVGAIIGPWDHSHAALRESGECVLAVPGADWAATLVEIGNCSGAELDKFERFGLATAPSKQVAAPRLADCLYNIECVIEDDTLAERHDLFVLRAVAAAVDFSADVADTVPVFAQAAQARFVYLAQEAPSPSAQAILVKRDSGIDTLAALKGKDIATTKAAGNHYLLLAALAKAALAPADVSVHYLTPADGRAAFERGSVGAWITWDPYVASVDRRPEVKVLADGTGLASYQRYYLAASDYAAAHPDQGAAVLAPIWGLDAATIERANARRSYAVRAVTAAHFGEQQKIADTFLKAGLLPARVDTRQALRWDFAARRAAAVGA
ncbi:flavin reductase [Burkholderia gladioli]|uniref:flavin reductase n=1 Tax=Burkholderia gladioli TaxID=28095 RepID=UPI0009E36ADD|nr:flavin reductase [Burkholderia gladioli]